VIFLLPPSETKAPGGHPKSRSSQLAFVELQAAREQVATALNEPEVLAGPVLPAINRYIGTLYSAIHGRGLKGSPTANNQLSDDELNRAARMVLIQSALFGLISATDEIASYKISPTKILNGLNLKKTWQSAHRPIWQRLRGHTIIDLRSKAYAELAPIDEESESYSVEVFFEAPSGDRTSLNHFNKKAKGQLVRAALLAKNEPKTISDLKKLAAKAGLKLELNGRKLTLVTYSNN
jgi:cytoplasmic iron level regulating protein YaaA (DUF328/UPF0246 family)